MRLLVLVLVLLTLLLSTSRYFLGFEGNVGFISHLAPEFSKHLKALAEYPLWELTHRLGGPLLAILGAIQLGMRHRWHRWMGVLYVALALLMSFGGAWMVHQKPFDSSEVLPTLVFAGLLAGFVLMGLVELVRSNFSAHRQWMARSFMVVLGPIVVRGVYILLWWPLGMDQHNAMGWAFWIGWSLPLVIFEVRNCKPYEKFTESLGK